MNGGTTIMIRLARRSACTHWQLRHILSSLSIALFAFLAIVFFTQPVLAEEAHTKYGTVIGIGMWLRRSFQTKPL